MAACGHCKQVVKRNETTRSVELRVVDGEEHYFGYNQPQPLKEATGKLKGVFHYKCLLVWKKQFRPTTDGRGRYHADTPTAYAQSASMRNRDDVSASAKARRERAEGEYEALKAERGVITSDQDAGAVEDLDRDMRALEEEIALAARQEEIEGQRALEGTPRGEDDWRDPIQVEV